MGRGADSWGGPSDPWGEDLAPRGEPPGLQPSTSPHGAEIWNFGANRWIFGVSLSTWG